MCRTDGFLFSTQLLYCVSCWKKCPKESSQKKPTSRKVLTLEDRVKVIEWCVSGASSRQVGNELDMVDLKSRP